MTKFNFSLQSILSLVIGAMGLLGLIFALVSGTIHQNHAFENQRSAMLELMRIKSSDVIMGLEEIEQQLGLSLQKQKRFRQAFHSKDIKVLDKILNNEFHRYFVTTGKIKLDAISIFSKDYLHITTATNKAYNNQSDTLTCDKIINKARLRKGTDNLKLSSGFCLKNNTLQHASLLPIGGLRSEGYMLVITDPIHNLAKIETLLGMPVTLKDLHEKTLFVSENWSQNTDQIITARYELIEDDETHLYILMSDKIRPLFESIPDTRYVVMFSASIITFVFILIVAYVLRKTTITPLKQLKNQLQLVQQDQHHLAEAISISGSKEIVELGNDFNKMSNQLNSMYSQLENMAYYDHLTGLPNRNTFQEQFNILLKNAEENQQNFVLYLMDLNKFKEINDTLGHHIGDDLLCKVAERLKNTMPDEHTSLLVRLGGDEFAALVTLENNDNYYNKSKDIAQKLLDALDEPFIIEDQTLIVGASIGITLYPDHDTEANELMRKADVAMYYAKRVSNGYNIYNEKYDEYSVRYLTIGRDLRTAIDNHQLELYYQPQVAANTGKVCGAEALIRWHHPELGMVPPDEFIPIAEQSGVIRDLTRWIVNRAIEQCAAWIRHGYYHGVAINLSASNLHDHKLIDDLVAFCSIHSVKPELITLEITESSIMSDPVFAVSILNKFKELGFNLSIDDFGTGYSSLSYVKKLPVNEIKVDRSFVKDVCTDTNDEAIIQSILVLAHHMNIDIVAEGVEDRQSYDKLRNINTDILQGYYLARPMPFDDLLEWLKTSEWSKTG